jgi:hypothetical protein
VTYGLAEMSGDPLSLLLRSNRSQITRGDSALSTIMIS